jgi:hypothetical protein
LNNFNNGRWDFPDQMGTGVGFVYAIVDRELRRAYIGKKLYTSILKGRQVPSNWRNYESSSKTLASIMSERPSEEFHFFAIEQYKTRGTLSYAETWSLCFVEAPTNVRFYNTRIERVSWSVSEPISDRHKKRLSYVRQFVEGS